MYISIYSQYLEEGLFISVQSVPISKGKQRWRNVSPTQTDIQFFESVLELGVRDARPLQLQRKVLDW